MTTKSVPGLWAGQWLHVTCLAVLLALLAMAWGRLGAPSSLLVAAFSHVYIWVHYRATEKPDMDCLYSSN